MSNDATPNQIRPMYVQVETGSPADKYYRAHANLSDADAIQPSEIATGVAPSPAHDLRFRGGKTVPRMTYTNLYVGGQQSWEQDDIKRIDEALAAAMNDNRLNNVMSQYFSGQQISCTFRPSRVLPGPPPAVVSQGDVEMLVARLHTQGLLDGFDLSTTIFNFLLPRGVVLNTSLAPTVAPAANNGEAHDQPAQPEHEADSQHGLGGYHGSVNVTPANGPRVTLYYSVGVFSEVRNGKANGIAVFDQPWKNVVATFYHELNEFRTDPDVGEANRAGGGIAGNTLLGWVSDQGEEIGDFPIAGAKPLTKVFKEIQLANGGSIPVQFQYSNAVHGPEGPIDNPHA